MARKLIVACFFVSGLAGLLYQIVWIRLLSLVLGNTVQAASMVVAAFLAGLAVGSYFWGRKADALARPAAAYAALELLIAVSALAVTAGIYLIDDLIVSAMTVRSIASGGLGLARFALVFAILLIPTALMGGTTPVMVRVYVRSLDTVGHGVGALYAANTYGAMIGAFLCGFALIPLLGVHATVGVAILLNLAVALAVFLLRPALARAPAMEPGPQSARPAKGRKASAARAASGAGPAPRLPYVLIGVAGFCSLGFEILWTRAFVVSFKATVYVFSNLLTVFLLGMALGSHVLAKRIDRARSPLAVFGLAQTGIAVLGLASVLYFSVSGDLATGLSSLTGRMTWAKDVIISLTIMGVGLALPTFLMGLSYPLICKAVTRQMQTLGRQVGRVYAIGTAGGILGSLAAAFALLPWLGLQRSTLLLSAIALFSGFLALRAGAPSRRGRRAPLAAAIALVVGTVGLELSGIDIGLGAPRQGETIFAKEGITGTVRVIRERPDGSLKLLVNNYQLAKSADIAVRFGHIPLLLEPDARDVLLISLGSGITAGAVGGHPVERIDCVEIVPTLSEIQPLFADDNHDIVKDRRLHLTFWDGRHFVRVTERRYDLIIADLFQPDSAGVGNLYSLEHYQHARAKLKPGGAMAQWLPMYQLSPQNLKVVMRTFAEAFDHVTVWYGDIVSEMSALLLVGSNEPLTVRFESLSAALARPAVEADLIEHADPLSFLSAYVTDREGLLVFVGDAPINSDDAPVIEYTAPHEMWSRQADALVNFESLIGRRQSFAPLVPKDVGDPVFQRWVDKYFKARTLILKAKVAHGRRDYGDEWSKLKRAAAFAEHDPVLAWAGLDLGYLFLENRERRTAAEILEWTLRVNPDLELARQLLAKARPR